eukprot:TRINITY_DN78644_c0_g1_i1.p1 TRINITY_DN78644_c0_g1~~TRINITY_DN78644_c0_g1_i1.p1  ORF type:complete len:454 (+),score=57.02 TRINITY_DN78644_c0_g1_i1:99-1364(+)
MVRCLRGAGSKQHASALGLLLLAPVYLMSNLPAWVLPLNRMHISPQGSRSLVMRLAGPVVVDAEEVVSLPGSDNRSVPSVSAVPAAHALGTAVITGASTGIGLATAEGMARSGHYSKIILAGRDSAKHEQAISTLQGCSTDVEFAHMSLDLSSLDSVREFVASFKKLELPLKTLVLNAGVMAVPDRRLTVDGFEYQFGVNHLSHFLLANLLLDTMVAAATPASPGRVIVLSSSAHQIPSPLLRGDLGDLQSFEYSPWVAYGQSKLANILFAYELDRRCREAGLPVAVNAVHPGVVNTELARYLAGDSELQKSLQDLLQPVVQIALKSPEDGARTSVLLATTPQGKLSGRYWQDSRPAASVDIDPTGELPAPLRSLLPLRPRLTSYDPDVWSELWTESELLVGLKPSEVSSLKEDMDAVAPV